MPDDNVHDARRRRLSSVAAAVAGAAAGAIAGIAISSGSRQSPATVPPAGLLYIGSILLIGGLVQLAPSLWRCLNDHAVRLHRGLERRSRRPTGPSPASFVFALLADRSERWRDSTPLRLSSCFGAIALGTAMIVCGLLR